MAYAGAGRDAAEMAHALYSEAGRAERWKAVQRARDGGCCFARSRARAWCDRIMHAADRCRARKTAGGAPARRPADARAPCRMLPLPSTPLDHVSLSARRRQGRGSRGGDMRVWAAGRRGDALERPRARLRCARAPRAPAARAPASLSVLAPERLSAWARAGGGFGRAGGRGSILSRRGATRRGPRSTYMQSGLAPRLSPGVGLKPLCNESDASYIQPRTPHTTPVPVHTML
jgi:hypothetical protein